MKRLALLLLLAWLAAPLAWCADPATVDDLFKQAKAAAAAGKSDDALALYERVIVEHPEAIGRWSSAQLGIATTLAARKDLEEAAKAAHLALDGAPNAQIFDSAVSLAANILSALDKNVDRANQLIAFQQTGPVAGATNPLDAVGYPSMPQREQAFEAMRQKAGDNAAASRLRAYTWLFAGKPREALAQFADAFRRSSDLQDLQAAGSDLTLVGLRAVRGHRVDLDQGLQFVIFGPNGPDGKPNTGDDLADPFAGILPPPPEGGEGGLAGLSAGDLSALRHLLDAAKLYAADPWLRPDQRRCALLAMQRSNDALDNWGGPGQKEWYLQIVSSAEDPGVASYSLSGAIGAAKGRALHLDGIQSFFNDLDAWCASRNIGPTDPMVKARKQWATVCVNLNKNSPQKSNLKPLTSPRTSF